MGRPKLNQKTPETFYEAIWWCPSCHILSKTYRDKLLGPDPFPKLPAPVCFHCTKTQPPNARPRILLFTKETEVTLDLTPSQESRYIREQYTPPIVETWKD